MHKYVVTVRDLDEIMRKLLLNDKNDLINFLNHYNDSEYEIIHIEPIELIEDIMSFCKLEEGLETGKTLEGEN